MTAQSSTPEWRASLNRAKDALEDMVDGGIECQGRDTQISGVIAWIDYAILQAESSEKREQLDLTDTRNIFERESQADDKRESLADSLDQWASYATSSEMCSVMHQAAGVLRYSHPRCLIEQCGWPYCGCRMERLVDSLDEVVQSDAFMMRANPHPSGYMLMRDLALELERKVAAAEKRETNALAALSDAEATIRKFRAESSSTRAPTKARIEEAHSYFTKSAAEQTADHGEQYGFKHRPYAQGDEECYICTLLRENVELRHDLERAMANHNADLNAEPSASSLPLKVMDELISEYLGYGVQQAVLIQARARIEKAMQALYVNDGNSTKEK